MRGWAEPSYDTVYSVIRRLDPALVTLAHQGPKVYADRFELYVDLPGIEPGTVELTLDGGILTLSGNRLEQAASKRGEEPQSRRIERGHGQFHRRFVLPDTADGEKVNASGKNGVLTVTIPKQAKSMPRRIQIDA